MPHPSFDSFDPLSLAIAPPADETDEERQKREQLEEQARKVSQQIDERISSERNALKKRRRPIKVLVLGQSESGKSTTIKNFQLAYAHQAWLEERASWRVVIHLNLLRSVQRILDALTIEMEILSPPVSPRPADVGILTTMSDQASDDEDGADIQTTERAASQPPLEFTEKHRLLKLRLAPLKRVQEDLEASLGAASTELEDMSAYTSSTSAAPFLDYETPSNGAIQRYNPRRPREFYVRSNCGWKAALHKVRPHTSTGLPEEHVKDFGPAGGRPQITEQARQRRAEDAVDVIAECREDIKALWTDPIVHRVLAKRNIRLEDSPGFFLNDVDRIATREYDPSDNDVVRARLRTMGVQEYTFSLERGSDIGRDWLMFDVAGARTSRAAWFPYFDDVNAIIFLAPISCFDEPLAEDRRVNRLADTFLLWKSVCSSKLLANVQLVLFLNKCDLLAKKLKEGKVLVRNFIPSFKDRSNDVDTVTEYFKVKFKEIMRSKSPTRRAFYAYLTSVVDTKSTAHTLGIVQEGILRSHLKQADFL